MSVSFSGELAWELHVRNEALLGCHGLLTGAGTDLGLRHFGLYATESMRIEKGYRHWKADLLTEYNPMESDLARFVRPDKAFIGKPALEGMVASGPRRLFVTLDIACDHAPAHPGASVLVEGQVIGTVTSAAWGHRIARNLAMAFVEPARAAQGTAVEVEILGERIPAIVCETGPYDPGNTRPRG